MYYLVIVFKHDLILHVKNSRRRLKNINIRKCFLTFRVNVVHGTLDETGQHNEEQEENNWCHIFKLC
jgi:hypothetical protein